jgi:hypothetical protein
MTVLKVHVSYSIDVGNEASFSLDIYEWLMTLAGCARSFHFGNIQYPLWAACLLERMERWMDGLVDGYVEGVNVERDFSFFYQLHCSNSLLVIIHCSRLC